MSATDEGWSDYNLFIYDWSKTKTESFLAYPAAASVTLATGCTTDESTSTSMVSSGKTYAEG